MLVSEKGTEIESQDQTTRVERSAMWKLCRFSTSHSFYTNAINWPTENYFTASNGSLKHRIY